MVEEAMAETEEDSVAVSNLAKSARGDGCGKH